MNINFADVWKKKISMSSEPMVLAEEFWKLAWEEAIKQQIEKDAKICEELTGWAFAKAIRNQDQEGE